MPYDSAVPIKNTSAPNASVINKQYSAFYTDSATGNTLEKIGGSAAWRYDNPGNLQYGSQAAAISAGAVGVAKVTDGGMTLYRGIFPTMEAGVAALAATLVSAYSGSSVSAALTKYAPPGSNDTASYIAAVTSQMAYPQMR